MNTSKTLARISLSMFEKCSSRRKEALIKDITTVSRRKWSLLTSAATKHEILRTRFLLSCAGFAFGLGAMVVHSQTAELTCTVEATRPGAIVAPICRGQQLEEFNYQFQGGLYAQLLRNPSFEELKDPIAGWTVAKRGASDGSLSGQTAADTGLLNGRQQHCLKLEMTSTASGSVGLANEGYWGIGLRNETTYKLSFWAKKGPHFTGTIKAALEGNEGAVYAQSAELQPTPNWQHFTCDLITHGISEVTGANRFVLYASAPGEVYFDVVTLMPPTWKNRPNGLRLDLAEKLAALKLRYIQFPGGCTAESASMDVCWNWKNSIGPLEGRPGSTRNRWGYKNDLYFGLDEYLQLCEDLGAEPVYVTSSGISENPGDKEWGAMCPLDRMQPIIDDILDLLVLQGTCLHSMGSETRCQQPSPPLRPQIHRDWQ